MFLLALISLGLSIPGLTYAYLHSPRHWHQSLIALALYLRKLGYHRHTKYRTSHVVDLDSIQYLCGLKIDVRGTVDVHTSVPTTTHWIISLR